jgi:ornithine cyclodeaminase/alanine dehydrogenase-like protein (mu-crystallin family)
MFDAFGLPIFDLSVAKAAYLRAREMGLGTSLPW